MSTRENIHGQNQSISNRGRVRPSINTDPPPPMSPVTTTGLGVSTERPCTDWADPRNSQSQEFKTATALEQMMIGDRSTATARMAGIQTHEVSQ